MRRRRFELPQDLQEQKMSLTYDEILKNHRESGEMTVISCLSTIIRCIRCDECDKAKIYQAMDMELAYVSKKLGVSEKCAALLAIIVDEAGVCGVCTRDDICRVLSYTSVESLKLNKDLDEMVKKRMIKSVSRIDREYHVTDALLEAIENDAEYVAPKTTGLTLEEMFLAVREEYVEYFDGNIKFRELNANVKEIIRNNTNLKFCAKVMEKIFGNYTVLEGVTFIYMCQRYANFYEDVVEIGRIERMCNDNSTSVPVFRQIAQGKSKLQKKGLVDFHIVNGFKDTTSLTLTDKAREEFLEGVNFVQEEYLSSHPDIIQFATITGKELYYNAKEGEQIERLHSLLDDEKFLEVQKRLQDKGMRRGFNCIFYGGPGTGKTASVYELARRSGRDIFQVDVSKLKSKWVGDSEKSVKGVFEMYRKLCISRPRVPILLFNEADAIFGKRNDEPSTSVDKMNNAMQNILLQGMEDIEGILIATTNLEGSLDPAFERRFIYKVKFELPSQESRIKMWKSMMPELDDAQAGLLAKDFAFSGGQIENIARKSAVEYVLSGEEVSLATLQKFCGEEMLQSKAKRGKIGF